MPLVISSRRTLVVRASRPPHSCSLFLGWQVDPTPDWVALGVAYFDLFSRVQSRGFLVAVESDEIARGKIKKQQTRRTYSRPYSNVKTTRAAELIVRNRGRQGLDWPSDYLFTK